MNKNKKSIGALLALIMTISIMLSSNVFAQESGDKVIEIISINDFHGNLTEDTREKGKNMGISKIINAVSGYRKANNNTIVVSAGDSYQGSAMSNLTHGAPVSEMFKAMGVTASAVGNHEFDWGVDWIEKWAKDGDFDFLATNIIDKGTEKPVSWAKPYKVVEKDGVKIAFIGLTTPETEFKTLPDNVKNYEFQNVKESAEKWVNYFQEGEAPEGKIDVIIALTHIGSFQDKEGKEISGEVVKSGLTKVKGLNGIITGHTHQGVAGMVDGVAVVQGYKYGRALGRITITLDKDNKVKSVEPAVDYLYNRKSELVSDSKGEEIYNKYEKDLKPILGEIVGKTETELSHERHGDGGTTILGKFVCDIMKEKSNVQIAISNEGGLRTAIPEGDISVGKLYEVMPFDNTLISMELSGEGLFRVMENGIKNEETGWAEVSGCKVYFDSTQPMGSRVLDIVLDNGKKVKKDEMYSVATNDFVYAGGDKYDFTGAENVVDSNKPIRDMVTEYIREKKNINYEFDQPLIEGKAPEEKKEDEKNNGDKEKEKNDNEGSVNYFFLVVVLLVGIGIVVVIVNKSKKDKKE